MKNQPKLPDFSKTPRTRLPLFRLGPNMVEWQTSTGRVRDVVWMEREDLQQVMATYRQQANALPVYKDHNKAEGAFGAMALEETADGIDQVWALNPSGRELVASGRYLYDSPEILARKAPDGRKRLLEVRSGSLVNEPARTGSQPLLMSAMQQSEGLKAMQDALDKLGGLEKAVKGLIDSGDAAVKAVGEALSPHLGPAIAALQAHAQQQVQVAAMSTTPAPTAQAKDAAVLGVEVLKMTGASSSDEALGLLEAKDAQIVKMSSLLVKMGVETGRLEAAEEANYAKMSPARLVARLGVAEPLNLGARHEPTAKTKTEEPAVDNDPFEAAIMGQKVLK